VRHQRAAARAHSDAPEETLTEILLTRLDAQAQVRLFNRFEESRFTGADWLWWWTDGHEWFGSLVQAKRMKAGRRAYDFGYTPRPSTSNPHPVPQVERLLRTARQLDVPAVYALYNAGELPRGAQGRCTERPGYETPHTRLQVAYLPALIADHLNRMKRSSAVDVLPWSSPIECIACPRRDRSVLPIGVDRFKQPDLVRFLLEATHPLPRRVAKALLDPIAVLRLSQYWDARPVDAADEIRGIGAADRTGSVFRRLPLDQGHLSEPYVEHVLRGLRSEPPEYLGALLDGMPPEELGDTFRGVRGVVVVSDG